MLAALVVSGLVALGGLAAGGALWVEHRRLGLLAGFVRARGWSWAERDDVWVDAFEGEPFGVGSSRRAEDVIVGTYGGRDLVAFDYSYRTHLTDANGQHRTQVHRWSVTSLRLPATLPLVEVEAAGWARLLPRVLGRGVEFESEQFNGRYRVRTDDPRLAYDLLPARTLRLLLDRPDVSLRLLGGCALTWEPGRLDPDGLLARLETVTALLDAVPPWVWTDRS